MLMLISSAILHPPSGRETGDDIVPESVEAGSDSCGRMEDAPLAPRAWDGLA